METAALSYIDLGLAGILVFVSMLLSWWLHLGLQRDMLWGAIRSFVQLALVGYVLAFIFRSAAWYWVALALAIMLGVAIHTARGRIVEPLLGKTWIVGIAIASGSLVILLFILIAVLRIHPWYDPRYVLPLAGMIVGNSMNAATLAIGRFTGAIRQRRSEIETALALGANAGQAAQQIRREALRTAIIPNVNSMLVVGIVSLPGMMTGQILAGNDPTQAVRYQIMVMYMITSAAVITSVVGVMVAVRSAFTQAHQLRIVEME